MARVVGLTGGIGTGKSAVAALLRQRGVAVIDADEGTRAVQARGTEGLSEIVRAFGPSILRPDGELDRAALAAVAFSDDAARRRLNAIVHPRVRAWMAERLSEVEERGDAVAVMDIPLLFEGGLEGGFDAVVLVYAPVAVALERLVRQRGMDEAQARARVAAQMPVEEKRRRAEYVIDNSGSLADLEAEVDRVWADVRRKLSDGARSG